MTDKEIYQQVLLLMETMQAQEEVHVAQAKLAHARIHTLERQISLLLDLVEMEAGYPRTDAIEQSRRLFGGNSLQREMKDLLSRIESQHERHGFLLSEMRSRIADL